MSSNSGSEKSALVTGANGFLGARLVKKLVARGERVKALVRAGANLSQLEGLPPDQVKIAVGDVRMCDRVFAGLSGCDRLYHVAATYSINEKRRTEIMADSIEGARATLEAARRAGIEKIVFTSSVATLGACKKETDVLDESSSFNLNGANSYVEAKVEGERLAILAAEKGAPIVIVNPAMMIGPGDWKPTPIGAQVIHYLEYSPGLRMPSPPGGFSYVDVDDVAEGHMFAMDRGRVGERYVLGGENLTNHAMFQLLADVTGLAEPGEEMSRGKMNFAALLAELYAGVTGEQPLLTRKIVNDYFGKFVFATSDKAKKELGFTPRPARESFVRACRWFLDNHYVKKQAARRARLELQPS